MSKLLSGFRTLTDNCRRLFKRHPAEVFDDKTARASDNRDVADDILDSNTQISVRIFPDKVEISKALVDFIVQELREFQTKSGIPKESNQRKLKGTLLLRLSFNTEDSGNICAKLLRLCNSKIEGKLVDYHINVTLYIKPGRKPVDSPHMSAVEKSPNIRPNLEVACRSNSKPSEITTMFKRSSENTLVQRQICDISKTVNLFSEAKEIQTDKEQRSENKTTDNTVSHYQDNAQKIHPVDSKTDLNKVQSFDIDKEKSSLCMLSDQENCPVTHPMINETGSNQMQILKTENGSFRSKFEVPRGINELRILDSNGAYESEETLNDNKKVENTPRVIAGSSSSICGSDMQVKSEEMSPDTEQVLTEPRIKAAPNTKTGGRTPGIDADAVMSRLTRVIKNATESGVWKNHVKSKQDNSYIHSLMKSFNSTGILNRVREEIAGLKSSDTLWIKETMKDANDSAYLISHAHKWEFYTLRKKFPELVSFDDYVRAKEKQLVCPSVRRKYIGLILYGSLGTSFEEKFPDFAIEIEDLDCLKCCISFFIKREELDPQRMPRFRKKCKARRRIVSRTLSEEGIRRGFIENDSDNTESLLTREEAFHLGGSDSENDFGSALDEDEKGHTKSDHEQLKNIDLGEDIANLRDVNVEQTEDRGDTHTTTATKPGHGTTYTYEENWTFEKDGISSLDDRIRTKRYGKGAKKRFEEPKVKVKTRGVANRHKTPLKQEFLTEDAPEVSPGNTIYEMLCNLSTDSGSCKDFKDTCKEQSPDKPCVGSGESEPDVRHFECVPSTVIMGKKNEFEDLGDRYGATETYTSKTSKNRKQRKKQQRANKVFHLENLNNSAIAESESDDLMEDSDSTWELDNNSQELMFINDIIREDYGDNLSNLTFSFYENTQKFTNIPSEPLTMKTDNILFVFHQTAT